MLLRWSTFLRRLRNKYILVHNFKVEVKLRFQEVSPRFKLLTIWNSVIEVFLKRLIVKRTLKLPELHLRQKVIAYSEITRDITAEFNCNFLGLISEIWIISRFLIISLIKTVKKHLWKRINLTKLQAYDRSFWYFVIRLMVPVHKKQSHRWNIPTLICCNLNICFTPHNYHISRKLRLVSAVLTLYLTSATIR